MDEGADEAPECTCHRVECPTAEADITSDKTQAESGGKTEHIDWHRQDMFCRIESRMSGKRQENDGRKRKIRGESYAG